MRGRQLHRPYLCMHPPRAPLLCVRFQNGSTALIIAAHYNHVEVMRELVAAGANINAGLRKVRLQTPPGGFSRGAHQTWSRPAFLPHASL